MTMTPITRLLISAGLSLVSLTGSLVQPAYADNSRMVQRLLSELGLDPISCGSLGSEISVYDQDDHRTCARSSAQYPAGSYFFDRDTYSIRRLGSAVAAAPAPVPAPAPVAPPAQTVYSPVPNPTYPYPYATPMPVAPVLGPTIFVSSNPGVPVDPSISAQISASLAARGLSLASCSANPGVVVLVGGYTACAYPTPTYPAGRYSLTMQ